MNWFWLRIRFSLVINIISNNFNIFDKTLLDLCDFTSVAYFLGLELIVFKKIFHYDIKYSRRKMTLRCIDRYITAFKRGRSPKIQEGSMPILRKYTKNNDNTFPKPFNNSE